LVVFDDGRPLSLGSLKLPEGVQLKVIVVHSPEHAAEAKSRLSAAGNPQVTHLVDVAGHLARRYDARPGTVYLIRPDQHVTARWRALDAGKVHDALRRALGLGGNA